MFFYNLGRPSQYQTVHKLCVGYNCQQSLRGLAPELLMSNPEVEQCTSIFQCIYYKYKDLNDLGGVCLEVNELGKQEIMEEKGEVGRNERLQIPGSW